jgi:hypothetical protein
MMVRFDTEEALLVHCAAAHESGVHPDAEVVKLVDTLASGASGGNPVEVQVLSSAPLSRLQQGTVLQVQRTHANLLFAGQL